MDDEGIAAFRGQQRQLLAWTLWQLGLREAPTSAAAHPPEPLPPHEAQRVDGAIERAREIDRRVRDEVFARLGFPWRFDDDPGIGPLPPLGDVELEALRWELDRRHRETLLGESEI